MDKLSLQLEPRTITGKKVKNLRKTGTIPASICGKGVQSESFQLDERAFMAVYRRVGRNGLIDLQLPRGASSAFVRQVQRHPVSQRVLHVDFRIVDLLAEMTADVPVVTVGENPIIERGAGVLSLGHTSLSIKGLPADLPQTIEVDISGIQDFTTSLYVRDLNLSGNVTILTPADDMLVTITASRMAVEEEAITEQEQMGEPELSSDNADTAGTENAGEDEEA